MTSSAGTTTLTYDFESRVTQITGPGINATYSYNGLDTRVGKTENSDLNTLRRRGLYVTDPLHGDGTSRYTPGVSRRTVTETRYFYAGLVNANSLTNTSQTVAAARIYDAFGNVTSSSGTWSGPFGYAGSFGYQQDASGLKLLGHRYYDPSTGRFLTRDPIKDGRNWYAYGAGEASPTNIADPTGLAWHDPMVVYVDPRYDGTVIVIGEPRKGAPQGWLMVPGGYHSHPGVDVDYIITVDSDGSQRKTFTWGLATPFNPREETQYAMVDKNGNITAPGPHSDDRFISVLDTVWMRMLNSALDRYIDEDDRQPMPGDPRPSGGSGSQPGTTAPWKQNNGIKRSGGMWVYD